MGGLSPYATDVSKPRPSVIIKVRKGLDMQAVPLVVVFSKPPKILLARGTIQ